MTADHIETSNDESSSETGGFYELQKPLIDLIETYLLENATKGRPMTQRAFSEQVGIHVAKVCAILGGRVRASSMDRGTLEKLAAALQISMFQVYLMSGLIKAEDVMVKSDMDETLSSLYKKMRVDKVYCLRVPSATEWNAWPTSAKLSMSMAYQDAISSRLAKYASQFSLAA